MTLTQESVDTELVTEQTMLGESPLRTIPSLLGINQLATGTVHTIRVQPVDERGHGETALRATVDGDGDTGG